MIRSSVFTFDESSMWDPKVIRQHLNIPEDQLNILRNLPEWSKHRDNGNTIRLEKDSICENSQSTKHISEEELNKQNIELFNKNSEARSILKTYKLKSTKLFRSTSLYEIDKISKNSSCTSHLKSALSLPDLHLLTENLYSKNLSSEFRSKNSSPERHSSSLIKNIDLPIFKESGITCITVQTNSGISEVERSECKISTENSKMEVDSQLPVAILDHVDKVRNNGTNVETIVENDTVSSSHTLKSTGQLNISSNVQPTHLTNGSKFDNSNHDVNIETSKLAKADGLYSCEKKETNLCIVEETIPSSNNNCIPGVSEKITKLPESEGLKSCEKNEPDSNVVKETICMDDKSTNENKRVEKNLDFQELTKANETSDQCTGSKDNSKELFASNKISSNDLESKNISDSHKSSMDAENAQQASCQDVKDNEVFAETLSMKRKLESKSRSSKKRRSTREKPGCLEERSIKKAGEISYCTEHLKTMLDILKQFS